MKNAILASLLILGLQANASWFQEHCSNGEGTVKMADGHDDFLTQVTEREWKDGGYETKLVTEGLTVETVRETKIVEESSNSCDPKEGFGWASWHNVNHREIVIRKEDGSLFSRNTVGVSDDLKTVRAQVICELWGNSESACD